jgi:hypothetical protein
VQLQGRQPSDAGTSVHCAIPRSGEDDAHLHYCGIVVAYVTHRAQGRMYISQNFICFVSTLSLRPTKARSSSSSSSS